METSSDLQGWSPAAGAVLNRVNGTATFALPVDEQEQLYLRVVGLRE